MPSLSVISTQRTSNCFLFASRCAAIVPPMPAFYNKPASVDDIVDHIVARVLDQFDIDVEFAKRWDGKMGRAAPVRPLK